jgi:hypothetical protein
MYTFFLFVILFMGCSNANNVTKNSSVAFDDFLKHFWRQRSLEINDIDEVTRKLLINFGCYKYSSTSCDQV